MKKEIVDSSFIKTDSPTAPFEVLYAYAEAKEWSDGILTTEEKYTGAGFHRGEKDGIKGFFVEKYIREFNRSSDQL